MEDAPENNSAIARMALFEATLKTMTRASNLVPDNPTAVPDLKLRSLVEFVKAISLCGDDVAKLDLLYENQTIPLGEPEARENVFLEDYEEKMEILTFIATSSFALQRDNYRCVLLGSHDPEVAHIYPHASTSVARVCSEISTVLRSVWGDRPIQEFMREIDTDNLDIAQNMITLSSPIRFWLDNFKIALEPLEERSTENELVLRIRYLKDSSLRPKKGQQSNYDINGLSINTDPKRYLRDILTPAGHKLELDARHVQTGQRIRDGHVFSVKTTDPATHPLPSLRIMQVQYRMTLMIRLAGASEYEDYYDDDSPDPTTEQDEEEIWDPNERIMSWNDF
ncbi:hypothetical protein LY76DRAFT_687787 [Colletotrichum caudatum]|nr:hypothetical protein LY76DRAFT_687787 [Colletotrichum caudatum]